MLELDIMDKNVKESFCDLAHRKFGKNSKAEIEALEEAIELWITQENEIREFWSLLGDLKKAIVIKTEEKLLSGWENMIIDRLSMH